MDDNNLTIAILFDKSQKLIVADNANARVIRIQENGRTFYDKEYVDYSKNQTAQREVMISSSMKELNHVWDVAIDNISTLRQYLRTEDAGLNVSDWVNIIPKNCTISSYHDDHVSLNGILQETTQFVYLFQYCLIALKEIHSRGIIHLDIKPDNICIPTFKINGQYTLDFHSLKLIDFDMAFSEQIPIVRPLSISVNEDTNLYQAPRLKSAIKKDDKQAQNELDFGVDLFALGKMLQSILKEYQGKLIPAINITNEANQKITSEIKSFIQILLRFETSIERSLDTHTSLISRLANTIDKLGLKDKPNPFQFSVNLGQIYDWDLRVTTYSEPQPIEGNTTIEEITTDPTEIKETGSTFVTSATDPESLETSNQLYENKSNDHPYTDINKPETIESRPSGKSTGTVQNYDNNPIDSIEALPEVDIIPPEHQPKPAIDKHDPFGLNTRKTSRNNKSTKINKKIMIIFLILIFTIVGMYALYNMVVPTINRSNVELIQPTPEPIQPTPEPVQPTSEPVQPTPEPIQPTPEPIQPTPEPVQPIPTPTPRPAPVPKPRPTPTPKPTPTPRPAPAEPNGDITLEDILDGEVIQAPVVDSDHQDSHNTDQDVTLDDILSSIE